MNNLKEVKTSVRGMRNSISKALKKANIYYTYNLLCSKAYIGEGFYINHKERANEIKPIYGNDKHAAYMSSLINNDFPLSSELVNYKASELAIYNIEFTYMRPRYPEFYYTLYFNNREISRVNGKVLFNLYLTNLDYEIFTDLYETDAQIINKQYFKQVGRLPLDNTVLKYYDYKKNDKTENKWMYEAAFYGMFAQLLTKDTIKEDKNEENGYKILNYTSLPSLCAALTSLGLNLNNKEERIVAYKLRNCQVPIALWQTAYLRYEEWKQFKDHINTVVYMNTDSIYCQAPTGNIVEDKIGGWKQEYNGEQIFFLRRNAYVVVDNEFNIKKAILGGLIENHGLNKEKLNQLWNGQTVKANTYDRDKNVVEIDLEPKFKLYKYDL